jgi:hypothetical protein
MYQSHAFRTRNIDKKPWTLDVLYLRIPNHDVWGLNVRF